MLKRHSLHLQTERLYRASSGTKRLAHTTPASVGAASGKTVATLTNSTLPNNSLFQSNPNANRGYLIETNPRFADYRTWLSSDYMINAMAYDPATMTKRLGDGFYEQKLVREQVAQLTGRRFLTGYSNDPAYDIFQRVH